jgi:hypothetical protein
MRISIYEKVQVITNFIWVNIRATCYMIGDFIVVKNIEWDHFLYTHLENEVIRDLIESKHIDNRFEIEYKELNF